MAHIDYHGGTERHVGDCQEQEGRQFRTWRSSRHLPLLLASGTETDVGQRGWAASFQNFKTQCGFRLAELVENHRMSIVPGGDHDEITEEFSQIKQKEMDKDGKLKIVGRDEVQQAIGRSPDTGDTFIMRMYF